MHSSKPLGRSAPRGSTLPARASADPEARYRRYGKDFGKKGHVVPSENAWMQQAPQVRVRKPLDRGKDQMGELAVLNERLAGQQAWQIRKRVEYLKRKRVAWESVYESTCKHDTALTLNALETAVSEVRSAIRVCHGCHVATRGLAARPPVAARAAPAR